MTTLLDSPAAAAQALERAKFRVPLLHLNRAIHVLEAAGFCTEDAREIALYGHAAWLLAADTEGDNQ